MPPRAAQARPSWTTSKQASVARSSPLVLTAWPPASHKVSLLCSWKANYLRFILPPPEFFPCTSSVLQSWYSKAKELIKVWSGHGFELLASAWLRGRIICGFTEKLQLWLFWPSFMVFSTFPGSNQNELFDGPSLDQALFPERHEPAKPYWPLLAGLSAIGAAGLNSFPIFFTCGHICPTGSTGDISSTQAAGQTFTGSPWCVLGVENAQVNFTNAKQERNAAGR